MSGESLRLGDSQEARDFAKRNLLCHPGRSAAESRDLRTGIGTALIADGTANGQLQIPDQVRDDSVGVVRDDKVGTVRDDNVGVVWCDNNGVR